MIEAAELSGLKGIRHGFMTRDGGVSAGLYATLNCGIGSKDAAEAVLENRARAVGDLDRNTQDVFELVARRCRHECG